MEPKRSWADRGYAQNVWLNVDDVKRVFCVSTNYCSDTSDPNVIEVRTKRDMNKLIEALRRNAYTEMSVKK